MCHYPNGQGRHENAGVAGLPHAYIVQQLADLKAGLRKSTEPRKANTNAMIAMSRALTDQEVDAAAKYFSSIPFKQWIKVIETDTVLKTHPEGGIFYTLPGDETEPIAGRIIETPVDGYRTVAKDPRFGFIAYAPVGSLEKGKALATTGGNGRTIACGACHGVGLKGLGSVPPIAGRSPSYMVRQMFDMQQGARRGPASALMTPVVSKLTEEDMVNIAAYTASLAP
jgi:cytochrome c553